MSGARRTVAVIQNKKVELSNLDKVLFPDDGIIKAELIEHYLKIAPTILRHIKGRPLSLVRYPDGITGQTFFWKNRPDWAPDWIDHIALGEEEKTDYILATHDASMVWLANLACVELHQIHSRAPHFDRPDYIVYDIDPPENFPFERVVEIAFQLKEHVESFGYHTFVKTTGGKGVHVVTPIEAKWSFDQVFETAAAVARPFVERNERTTTLHIKKEARKGKVLIDIYRNRTTQSIVSPYSVRGRPLAPVSMPLSWDELRSVLKPSDYNLRNALKHVVQDGDAWETIGAYATSIHTERPPTPKRSKPERAPATDAPPEPLKVYAQKRSFERTPEPGPEMGPSDGNAFVIHRHHASRLHYDLRLERDGTLKCWAVPKGLPPRPGVKRLAVATEDHPLMYLTFEGVIPKGEYGGGPMWIYSQGKWEVTKQKKEDFYFRLRSREVSSEYHLIHTRDKEWLLDRVDAPQVDWLVDTIEPMLAESRENVPDSPDYLYEVKWDGIRAMVALEDGRLTIRSRNQRDITHQFPELLIPEQAFRAATALFDVEIVCLDPAGKPLFEQTVRRLHNRSDSEIERARARHPAVCYVFDCLYLDGRPIVKEPLVRRREWIADAIRQNPVYRVSETVDDGVGLYEAAAAMGLEGIMAKERSSVYLPGKRSAAWLKIKSRRTTECTIIGYTHGKGDRSAVFGALQLARFRGDRLHYVGKVGTGFDARLFKSIQSELAKLKPAPRPVEEKPLDDAQTVWLEPVLVCEVRYASIMSTGTLREPVFVRMRPDYAPEDCRDG